MWARIANLTYIVAFNVGEAITLSKKLGNSALAAPGWAGDDQNVVAVWDRHGEGGLPRVC